MRPTWKPPRPTSAHLRREKIQDKSGGVRHGYPGLFTDRALPKPIRDDMEPSVHIEVVPASDLERDPALEVATKVRPARRPPFEADAVALATPAEGDTVKLGAIVQMQKTRNAKHGPRNLDPPLYQPPLL